PAESSLYTSTSATPEAFAFIHKPVSHFSNSSPSLSQHVETADSFSPVPSPLSTGGLHVNHMKARKTSYMTVKEKLPTSATATQRISSTAPKHLVSGLDETSSSESPSTPSQAQPWDYFGLSHPIDKQLSFQNNRGLNHGFDIADEISCLEEDEGIPELEGEGDIRASTNEKGDMDSEDDFDEPSNEPLASGMIRREYDMKCRLLRHKESISESRISVDKTRAVVKDLHSRIRVAIQRIDSISKKIEEIRDKELQPQLEELIGGLTRMWRMMLNYHSHQYSIILSASNNGSTKVSVRSEWQHQATFLESELNSLGSNFTEWMSAHKSYLEAINGWLLKCIVLSLKRNKSSRRKPQPFSPKRAIAPPIYVTCRDWLNLLDQLPMKEVVSSIKDLVNVTTHFFPCQEKVHATSKLSFSLPRKAEQKELGEHIQKNDSSVDCSLNSDHLQSALTIFLDRLRNFAESSVSKYEALQKSIEEARAAYERSELRT
ncbi:hypothetical protein BHE74_00001550, partial [Ensete ventricosum]